MLESLDELLSMDMSDEAAYHLVNFMMELSLTVESHYYHQLRRYHDENFPADMPDYLK